MTPYVPFSLLTPQFHQPHRLTNGGWKTRRMKIATTDHIQETQITALKMDTGAMNVDVTERPVKPLKKSGRAVMKARSLPSCVLQLSRGLAGTEANDEINEDDWSSSTMFSGPFEPMAL